jgi:hypothetical protein
MRASIAAPPTINFKISSRTQSSQLHENLAMMPPSELQTQLPPPPPHSQQSTKCVLIFRKKIIEQKMCFDFKKY